MTQRPEQEIPFFSIIIPTYRRPAPLAECLQALAKLDYPKDRFEVIVVDDGSPLPPESVVASFFDQLDITLLIQTRGGPALARNTGGKQARGNYYAFTDDDCVPTPDWLKTLARRFAAEPDGMVGGPTRNGLPENIYSEASQCLTDYLYAYFHSSETTPKQTRFFTSNNLALPANRFHEMGGFHKPYPSATSEDRELCDRWLFQGYRMTYAPEAVVYHKHVLTLGSFWHQHSNYGRGGFHYHLMRAKRVDGRIRVEPFTFYLNLLRFPFTQGRSFWQAGRLVVLLLVTQAANTAGFFSEWLKKKN